MIQEISVYTESKKREAEQKVIFFKLISFLNRGFTVLSVLEPCMVIRKKSLLNIDKNSISIQYFLVLMQKIMGRLTIQTMI